MSYETLYLVIMKRRLMLTDLRISSVEWAHSPDWAGKSAFEIREDVPVESQRNQFVVRCVGLI